MEESSKRVMLQVSVNTENIRDILMFLYDEITRQGKEIGFLNRNVENLNKLIEVKALSQKVDDYIENTNKRVEGLHAHVDSMSKSFVEHQENIRAQLTETKQSNNRDIRTNAERVESIINPLMDLPGQMNALQAKFDAALSDDATSTRIMKQNEMENTIKEMQTKLNQLDTSYQTNHKAMCQRMQRAEVKLANTTPKSSAKRSNSSLSQNDETSSTGTRSRGGIPLGNSRRSSLGARSTSKGSLVGESDEEDFHFEKRGSLRRSSEGFHTRDGSAGKTPGSSRSLPGSGMCSSSPNMHGKRRRRSKRGTGDNEDGYEYYEYDEQLQDSGSSSARAGSRSGRIADARVNRIVAELVAKKEKEIQDRANAQMAQMYHEMNSKIQEMEKQVNETSTIIGAARRGLRERAGDIAPLMIPPGEFSEEGTAIGAFPCKCLACGRPKPMTTTPTSIDTHLWGVLNCPPLSAQGKDLTSTCSSVKVMRTQSISGTVTARAETRVKKVPPGNRRNIKSAQASRPISSRI